MLIDLLGFSTLFFSLTSFLIIAIVGFITEAKFQNPFVILVIIFYIMIGVRIWKNLSNKNQN